MSYAVITLKKFKRNDIKGIYNHDFRITKVKTNPDIDKNKTQQNYTLKEKPKSYNTFVNNRISQLSKTNIRKDAVVMVGAIVTSDKDFFDNCSETQQLLYFQKSYEFIAKRYGEKNIVSAVVHLDEKTPHMHINFVPVSNDRLCAKELINRNNLIELQDSFYNNVGIKFQLERGIQGSKSKHVESLDFKKHAIKKNIEELKEKKQLIENNPVLQEIKPIEGIMNTAKIKKRWFGLAESNVVLRESKAKVLVQRSVDLITERQDKQKIISEKENLTRYNETLKRQKEALEQTNKHITKQYRELEAEKEYLKRENKILSSIVSEVSKISTETQNIAKLAYSKFKDIFKNEKSKNIDKGIER